MKFYRLIGASLLVLALAILFHNPLHLGSLSLPPPGKVLSPYTGFIQNAEASKNGDAREELQTLPGLSEEVTVVFNEREVPRIFAGSVEAACFVQGYLHATNRLFQMQMISRATAGRISSIVGKRALEHDRRTRRIGMSFAAERELEAMKAEPEIMRLVESYCDGVNARLAELSYKDLPVEFKLLDFRPEPWTPLDVALVIQSLTYDLSFRHNDAAASAALEFLGRDDYEQLFPYYPPLTAPVISKKQWNFDPVPSGRELPDQQPDKLLSPQNTDHLQDLGSNNWAVSAHKTREGYPILANDPHLPLRLPSIWYEIQISTPENHVYGGSFPGIPGVVLGFNEYIAWGSTNGSQDVLDWYRIQWADKANGVYILDSIQVQAYPRREQIEVRGDENITDTVWYTVFGPAGQVETDSISDYAMFWLAHKDFGRSELSAFLGINKAKNYTQFRTALESFSVPVQNFAFASVHDTIAMHVQGRLPIRPPGDGLLLKTARTVEQTRWKFIPLEHLPSEVNPERGFVFSTNQPSVDSNYPYPLPGHYDDYRGRYLQSRLDSLDHIEVADMMALQYDMFSLEASETVKTLLSMIDRSGLAAKASLAYDSLDKWDFHFRAGSRNALMYELFSGKFMRLAWDEWYDAKSGMLRPEHFRTVHLAREMPDYKYFDLASTDRVEDATAIADSALQWAAVFIDSLAYYGIGDWAEYKRTTIKHLADLPAFGKKVRVGGQSSALNATNSTKGPSWRMVVQMSRPPRAWVVYPGGQSGNPGSPFYDTGIDKWVKGEYYETEILFSAKEAGQNGGRSLELKPEK